MNHGDASWWTMMIHHDESWFIMMSHNDSSSRIITIYHDESWWFIIMKHHAALKGLLFRWSWSFFCHGCHDIFSRCLFAMVTFSAMAPMAFLNDVSTTGPSKWDNVTVTTQKTAEWPSPPQTPAPLARRIQKWVTRKAFRKQILGEQVWSVDNKQIHEL